MNYKISTSEDFDRAFRKLAKRHRSLKDDFKRFVDELRSGQVRGVKVIENVYKFRMSVTSKGKGKSGGARIVGCDVCVDADGREMVLLTIYDKTDRESVSDREIQELKSAAGL